MKKSLMSLALCLGTATAFAREDIEQRTRANVAAVDYMHLPILPVLPTPKESASDFSPNGIGWDSSTACFEMRIPRAVELKKHRPFYEYVPRRRK